MYLKNIEVQGFKSFANRTLFQFHNGITGIVGPNGSGKSNVADAVRWVLGEQRVKQLRGGSMQDVIFAGTAARKPLGYASVAITLDNADHALPVSYDEVTVTRRLYRSGESEYLINGTACRLKDINELFYDTGIGKEGYSIIGQGQIERIISGKPEERRELFDEAAGIVKFKRRKQEARRKLDSEEANLVRVNDILSELDRQIGPLGRQAEKAKIYLAKREELKAYDVNLFLAEIEEIRTRLEESRKSFESAGQELEEAKQEADAIRSRYEDASRELEELEERQGEASRLLSEHTLKKSDMEHQIQLMQEQSRLSGESVLERENRKKDLQESVRQSQETLKLQGQAAEGLQEQAQELGKEADRLQSEHDELQGKIERIDSMLELGKKEQIDLLNERTRIKTQAQHYDTMLEQIGIRRAQLSSQILTLKSEENNRTDILSALRAECDRIAGEIEELNAQSSERGETLQQVQEQLTAQNQQMETDQTEYHKEASRLESLRNIAERYDGYGSSIRRVMEQKDRVKGICGVVADLITTQAKYETAIETALGGSIQNIVTENEDVAKQMIAFLKENKYGRATFLPLTSMQRSEPFKQTSVLNEKGVIGIASTLVRVETRYASLTSHLLGRTLVVDQIDHAVQIARKYKYSLRIVTLEGELLSPGGSMTGGAFRNSSNLLGRRREIDDLKKDVLKRRTDLETLRTSIDETRTRRNALRDEIREISGKLQEKYLEKNTADLKLQELQGYQQQAEKSREQIQRESSEAAKQAEDIHKDQDRISKLLGESESKEQEVLKESEMLRQQLDTLHAKEQEVAAALEKVHVDQASGEQKEAYFRQEQERIRQEIAHTQEEIASIDRALEEAHALEETRTARIDEIRAQIRERDDEIAKAQAQISELGEKKDELGSRQKKFFDEREQESERITLLDREYFRLQNQIEKMEETQESRISYMWEEYELTYSTALALRREDLGNRNAWRRQMGTLRKEIRDLGSVNVNAIEEYKEVAERHQFLHKQQEDIVEASKALEKIIAQLDAGMRKQFREQFERICQEFDRTFQQLFGGGKGTLELVEEDDILEAGIRIIAQPPGKKLQNMMQLSGGEKALTAIALLFAIQGLKPSPFCLLDEIEAALDESNVERYAGYLHKLTKHTQFIIITHRRGTMAAADRLYGVTMQEKGVSALVSVDLIEAELDK